MVNLLFGEKDECFLRKLYLDFKMFCISDFELKFLVSVKLFYVYIELFCLFV